MKNEIIKKIEIEIAGVAVSVTPKEAKALFDALGELLNLPVETVRVVEKEVLRDRYPYPYWYSNPTFYTTGMTPPKIDRYTITCDAGSANISVQAPRRSLNRKEIL